MRWAAITRPNPLYGAVRWLRRKGLYFAGELIDVDAICGGYNLTWAWASGYVAGQSAASA